MTIAAGDRIFVDTNVLLTATAPARRWHRQALYVLEKWPASGVDLVVSGQVIREYLVVATRAIDVNGLGLSVADARANVEQLVPRMTVLEESRAVLDRLLRLVRDRGLSGKRIHDVNIVATALAHGIAKLVTDNAKHFRGHGQLTLVDLKSVAIA